MFLDLKDDYINASRIEQLSPLVTDPSYIVTQCPLPCTQQDFWTMVWEQQVPNPYQSLSLTPKDPWQSRDPDPLLELPEDP